MNYDEVSKLKPGDLVEITMRSSQIAPKKQVVAEFRARILNEAVILLDAKQETVACERLMPHVAIPGTLYACQNAAKCGHATLCPLAEPHEFHSEGCFRGIASGRRGCVIGSVCVPYAAGERKKLPDPDIELAKEAAKIHKTRVWLTNSMRSASYCCV